MFESAALDHKIEKAAYKKEEPKLRESLLSVQYDLLRERRFSTLILIAGVDGAGKGETVNLLNEWMDPRHIEVTGFPPPTDEERERPPLWRFWRPLPPKGKIGIFFGAWHTEPIVKRVSGEFDEAAFAQRIGEILRFEKMLVDEGVLLLKFWFHLSKAQQKARLKELEKNPRTHWRVTKSDWKLYDQYNAYVNVCESFLRETSSGEAPWLVVPGADDRYRSLTVGREILDSLTTRLARKPSKTPSVSGPPPLPAIDKLNVLRSLDLNQPMTREEYKDELEKWQLRLNALVREPRFHEISVVAVFEGNDAAGKGGAIRRVTRALDARFYKTVSIAAPTDEERARPYLWRFWRQVPRRGFITIFDRSWYGRVLVERVEGFAAEADWMRAYTEIVDFEQELVRNKTIVVKFWLAIGKEEQLKRFQLREKTAFKRFKITEEDWRNRKKWDAYERAICDMVDRTSTTIAPWTIVEANNKLHARVKVLKTLVKAIEKAIGKKNGKKNKKNKKNKE
jgi:polyphosphate:AMP phosphotransferase